MAIANTSPADEAHQMLFTKSTLWQGNASSEREVWNLNEFEYCSVVWIDIECKNNIQMHIQLDQRMHKDRFASQTRIQIKQ